ncbi:MAG: sulfotransferase family protein [Gaiella sp.]
MRGPVDTLALNLRMTKRLARRPATLVERLGALDERLVFVIGSPRSGTTFLAGAIGAVPGFVDLGEVAPLKAAVPRLAGASEIVAAGALRKILGRARRFGLVGSVRAVEQTPEMAYLADAAAVVFPDARFVHIVRDGRDVVCSLLERGWLGAGRTGGADDAGLSYGVDARFWVEPERRAEFGTVSEARRAAWAWRCYVSAARAARCDVYELRYEALAADPAAVAIELAAYLGCASEPLARGLAAVHRDSIGRFRRDLGAEQLADVEVEAGVLLAELGYS